MALFTVIVLVVVTALIGLSALIGLWQVLWATSDKQQTRSKDRSRRGLRN
ncbi:hypothetical protein [Brooklawnia sp.]